VHDLDLLPRLADRAIALRRGVVVADVAVDAHTPAQLRGVLK
jgi:ABC-type cobalamin/Fe3+-siderophores transport system ATPase subunit